MRTLAPYHTSRPDQARASPAFGRHLGHPLDLLAELADVDAQLLGVGVGAPDSAQDQGVGQHLAGVDSEEPQQVVLLGRELHLDAVAAHDTSDGYRLAGLGGLLPWNFARDGRELRVSTRVRLSKP